MIKTIVKSSVATIVLFVVAALLIVAGSIGAAQAAPRIQSEEYRAEAVMTNIHVGLKENGNVVENGGKLLQTFLADNNLKEIKIGDTYDYALSAYNDRHDGNTIDQYVRVTVRKYWVKKINENEYVKEPDLDPSLIDLTFDEDSGWVIDGEVSAKKGSKYKETTVLYYTNPISPGQTTNAFTKSLRLDEEILDEDGNVRPEYKNKEFMIEATVDAVQTHNEIAAKTGAWGRVI